MIIPSICRNCLAYCPILVTVQEGRAIKVSGDPNAPAFDGYTCPKGRALPAQHNDPQRLLHAQKRQPDGTWASVGSDEAVREVTAKIQELLARHGPRSIAMYAGTGPVSHPTSGAMARSWFRAIGSRMVYSAASIDKPAEYTSVAMHGNWVAGLQTFETSDTWMIIGANPVIAKSNGAPLNNPGVRLKQAVERGMKLVVIDPRRTETAKRAHVHLQIKPGEDPAVLAGIIHLLLREGWYDQAFVGDNAEGLDTLRQAVQPYTPEYVCGRAGIEQADLVEAARCFGTGKRGGAVCSTGPSFGTRSNLAYYLALCLNTLCGRWARVGDRAPYPNVLLPAYTPKAQPYQPYPVMDGPPMRVLGLRENASGVPTAALADEILLDGDGQIKALFCIGGNPVLSWPDQGKTEAALRKLELLVVFDYRMTATAGYAHYVVPPPLSLEVPATSQRVEALKYAGVSRGYPMPWAQYTPAVVPEPPGSAVISDADFFFRMAQQMRLQIEWINARGAGPHQEGPPARFQLDMDRLPAVEELLELMCRDSRVPLSDVKQHPHGHVYDEIDVAVEPRDADCTTRLQLGDPLMMRELGELHSEPAASPNPEAYPYRLVCRRANVFMNSVGQSLPTLKAPRHTPAAMHPDDLAVLGIQNKEVVTIRSPHGEMLAQVEPDASLRLGVLSVVHGFGGRLDEPDAAHSVTRLIGLTERDPISGIPRMTGVPVTVERAGATTNPIKPSNTGVTA